ATATVTARSTKPAPGASPSAGEKEGMRASPAAQRTAAETGADLSRVQGTGRGGVISKADVMDARSVPSAPAAPTGPKPVPARPMPAGERETREKMSTRRKRIAENLLESQHATAHLTTFNEIDMSAINALREKFKEKVEKEHGVKLTFMPLFVRATVAALKQFPMVNAQIDGDTIVYRHYANMGIAVASDQG